MMTVTTEIGDDDYLVFHWPFNRQQPMNFWVANRSHLQDCIRQFTAIRRERDDGFAVQP